jgi:hypothetical protein
MQIQEAKAAGKELLAEELTAERNSRKGYAATPKKSFWKKCTNALTCSSTPVNNNAILYGPLPKVPTPNATTPSALSVRNYPAVTPVTNLGQYSHIGKKQRPNIPVQPTTPLNNNYTRARNQRHSLNRSRHARILEANSRLLKALQSKNPSSIYNNLGGGSRKRSGSKRSKSSKRKVTRKNRN